MKPHRPHKKGTNEDFGIPPDKAAEYAKHKGEDHLGRPAGDRMVGSGQSVREHGVGATSGQRGKGSGGDVDADLLGLEPLPGRLEPTKSADGSPNVGGSQLISGHIQPSGPEAAARDDNDSQSGGGIANNRGSTEDDAFVSEVTFDEATGRDEKSGG